MRNEVSGKTWVCRVLDPEWCSCSSIIVARKCAAEEGRYFEPFAAIKPDFKPVRRKASLAVEKISRLRNMRNISEGRHAVAAAALTDKMIPFWSVGRRPSPRGRN